MSRWGKARKNRQRAAEIGFGVSLLAWVLLVASTYLGRDEATALSLLAGYALRWGYDIEMGGRR